jgi:nucleoside-diphosphate-sugar epimerase
MSKQALILITGATGAVGPLVVKAFHTAGYAIRTLSIDPPPIGIWPDDVETRIGDVTDASAVQAAMENVESVIHMAALLHVVNQSSEMIEKYQRINVEGTKNVVASAIEAELTRIVLFSTIAVYGSSNGYVLNELSPVHPDTLYAKTKYAAEQMVLNARGINGLPLGTVLRFGAIYGSRIKGNYERLTHALAHNRFIPIGSGLNRRTLIYDKDVGRAVVQAVSHPAAVGRLFNVTDGGFHTVSEIIESICLGLGRLSPRLLLPIEPIRRLIYLIETGSRAIGLKPPVTRGVIDKYSEDIAVDGSLFQKEIDFVPHYDLKTGWEETISEMRNEKII